MRFRLMIAAGVAAVLSLPLMAQLKALSGVRKKAPLRATVLPVRWRRGRRRGWRSRRRR